MPLNRARRLTGGTLGFMALSSIIILLYLYRQAGCGMAVLFGLRALACARRPRNPALIGQPSGRDRVMAERITRNHQPHSTGGWPHPPAPACATLHTFVSPPRSPRRRVPHKGKLFAGTAVFGSSFLATMRWLFGVWLPSANQVGGSLVGATG